MMIRLQLHEIRGLYYIKLILLYLPYFNLRTSQATFLWPTHVLFTWRRNMSKPLNSITTNSTFVFALYTNTPAFNLFNIHLLLTVCHAVCNFALCVPFVWFLVLFCHSVCVLWLPCRLNLVHHVVMLFNIVRFITYT